MARSQSKADRVAFFACTSVAIVVIVGVWVWNVRTVVEQGVSGAKQVIADVSQTASDVKTQSAPDPETAAVIKAGIHAALNAAADKQAAKDAEQQATVDAVARAMSKSLTADADGTAVPEDAAASDATKTE